MGLGGHNVPFVADDHGIRALTIDELLAIQGLSDESFNFFQDLPKATKTLHDWKFCSSWCCRNYFEWPKLYANKKIRLKNMPEKKWVFRLLQDRFGGQTRDREIILKEQSFPLFLRTSSKFDGC